MCRDFLCKDGGSSLHSSAGCIVDIFFMFRCTLNRVNAIYCAHMKYVLCMLAFETGILWYKALAFKKV